MANKDLTAAFESTIRECMETPIEKLIARPELGALNFEEMRNSFEILFQILDAYSKLPLNKLSDQISDSLNQSLLNLLQRIDEIKGFSITAPDSGNQRTQIINNFNAHFEGFFQSAALWLSYLRFSHEDVQQTIDRLTSETASLETFHKQNKKSMKDKISEIDSIILAAREAAGSAGVSHYTEDFEGEAGARESSANRWLAATAFAAIGTIISAVVTFLWLPLQETASAALIVQHVTTKFIVLGILFSATVWCGQMYRANKHQATENRTRANGLKTFQAFVEATNDPQTRDAVLMETTRSIFSHGPTGYINQPHAAEGSGRIVEIVRSAAEKAASE